jgi:hypothetical protein
LLVSLPRSRHRRKRNQKRMIRLQAGNPRKLCNLRLRGEKRRRLQPEKTSQR